MKNLIIKFILLFLLSFGCVYSQATQQWVQRYNSPINGIDGANAVAVDGSGNVYVTGFVLNPGTSGRYNYFTIKYNSAGALQWGRTYNGPDNLNDDAKVIAVDNAGNVYVSGVSQSRITDFDIVTVKYNTSGAEQWVMRYNGTGNDDDNPRAIVLDALSNVYITGSSWGSTSDIITIKYNSAGVQQWAERYDGISNLGDAGYDLAIDAAGNVYITGLSNGSPAFSFAYTTIKYNSSGVQQWVAIYDGPGHYGNATSIGLDFSGNVYVTGASQNSTGIYDIATVKYNSSGAQQWVAIYDGPVSGQDGGSSLAVDSSGNVYVTGVSKGAGSGSDYITIKYNTGGTPQWIRRYNGPGNSADFARKLLLDSYNNVYITGYSMGSAADTDYATIKYNSSGELKWIARFNSPYALRDDPQSIALDNTMNVYVTGWSRGTYTNLDYATIKYIQGIEAPTQLSAYAISSSKIGLSWTDNSENETGFKIERTTTAGANWMLIGSVLRNHSTYTDSGLTANTTYHYRVYAYNPNGNSSYSNAAQATTLPIGIAKSEEVPDKFRLYMNYPNPFNPVTKISFDIPKSSGAKLVIYNISGKVMETLVNQKLSAGKYEVTWFAGNYSSGVYFCRIEAGNFTAVRKMVLVK